MNTVKKFVGWPLVAVIAFLSFGCSGVETQEAIPEVEALTLLSSPERYEDKNVSVTGYITKEIDDKVFYTLAYQYDVWDGEMDWSLVPVREKTWELTDTTGTVTVVSSEHASFFRLLRVGRVDLNVPENEQPDGKVKLEGVWKKDEKNKNVYFLDVSQAEEAEDE